MHREEEEKERGEEDSRVKESEEREIEKEG